MRLKMIFAALALALVGGPALAQGSLPSCSDGDYARYADGAWRCSSNSTYFDPHWTNVSLLLHLDGSDGSTTFLDSSSYQHTVAKFGNAQIDTAQYKFGGASLLLDGAGDYLTATDAAAYNFGAGNFTIEFWVRRNANGRMVLVNCWSLNPAPYSGGWGLEINASNQLFFWWDYGPSYHSVTSTGTVTADSTWHHIAVVRNGSSWKLYIDGTNDGSATQSDTIQDTSWGGIFIGIFSDGSFAYNGWLDEVRVTKGIARYTANFTPPTAAFLNQ